MTFDHVVLKDHVTNYNHVVLQDTVTTKNINHHYRNDYGNINWQDNDLPRGTSTHKVT